MLEKFLPNLYGWLVWGGGFAALSLICKLAAAMFVVAAIFGAGFFAGRFW